MHLEKAIIVTDSTGVTDYVRDGENALLYQSNSNGDLVEKVRQLWDDPCLCEKLGKSGSQFASAYCTHNVIKSHLCGLLREYVAPVIP
jgi:glycosyltransferase involved in cell wall biosynthesis